MENLLTTWISTQYGTIGIAAIKDPVKDETVVRALPVKGISQEEDKEEIGEWGGRVSYEELRKIMSLAETNGTLIR